MTELALCTTILRDEEELDVRVLFGVHSFTRGHPAVMHLRNGDPGWPAEDDEWEFDFIGAELDPPTSTLTEAELTRLEAWFDTQYQAAVDVAGEDRNDDADRGDYEYDRRRDDEMMERRQ